MLLLMMCLLLILMHAWMPEFLDANTPACASHPAKSNVT